MSEYTVKAMSDLTSNVSFGGGGGGGGGGRLSRSTASNICTYAGVAATAAISATPAGKGAIKAATAAVKSSPVKAAISAVGVTVTGQAVHAACTSVLSANYSGAPDYSRYNAMGDYH